MRPGLEHSGYVHQTFITLPVKNSNVSKKVVLGDQGGNPKCDASLRWLTDRIFAHEFHITSWGTFKKNYFLLFSLLCDEFIKGKNLHTRSRNSKSNF